MRALRIWGIALVILAALFVAVDRVAVNIAESQAEERVRVPGAQIGSTDVSVKGFPFLTQLAGSELDEVDVKITGIETRAGGRTLRISTMNAELHDVRLTDGFSGATAARATGTAVISYEDLTKAASDGVAVEYGGKNKVKVTGTVDVLGRPISRSVLSTVTLLDGRTVRVHADKVPGEGIPGLEKLVREKTDFEREVGGLPNGLKLERIQPTARGLEISVTGTDVRLAG
ncbi:LmeA family phospholipid-binding protein [Streptomyces sp. NPDC001665]